MSNLSEAFARVLATQPAYTPNDPTRWQLVSEWWKKVGYKPSEDDLDRQARLAVWNQLLAAPVTSFRHLSDAEAATIAQVMDDPDAMKALRANFRLERALLEKQHDPERTARDLADPEWHSQP